MHPLVQSALHYAARAHRLQVRKGSDVPYIVHPLGVMFILFEVGERDPHVLAAALLHDTVEDTGASLAEITRLFGPEVAAIVEGCSEPDKNDTWEARKTHTVAHLRHAPPPVLLVAAADKLHNLRSIQADHAALGEKVWDKFKRGRAETGWYYRAVTDSLKHGLPTHPIVAELEARVNAFFGSAEAPNGE